MTETEVGWEVAVSHATPSKQELDAMLKTMVETAKIERRAAMAKGLSKETIFKTVKAAALKDLPYLAECVAVFFAMGGSNVDKSGTSEAFRIGSLVHHKLIGVVSHTGNKTDKPAKKTVKHTRASISRKFKLYKEVCDRCELIPGDQMCSVLMDVEPGKIAEYRREMINMGYEFKALDTGWISVSNPRKATEKRLQEQIEELTRQLNQLRNE